MKQREVWTIVGSVVAVLSLATSSESSRWYGSFSLSAQKTRQSPAAIPRTGLYSSQALLNLEDVLFYKNRIRLAGNFDWRDDMYTTFREYRPIYYADLKGYGYAINTSWSPYKRTSAVAGDSTGTQTIDIFVRDLRTSLGISVPKYPTLNAVFNRYRQFDKDSTNTVNALQRTWVIESGYQRNSYSVRGNYNRTKREDYLQFGTADVARSWSGAVTALTPTARAGSVSASYNYYDTKRSVPGLTLESSNTHSVTVMGSSQYIKRLSVATSYSGRFTSSIDRFRNDVTNRSETMSGMIGYSPTGYLELAAHKAYQIDRRERQYEISEYIAYSAALSRYIRRGVDTRVSMTRTVYQQSNRAIQFLNSAGDVDSVRRINHFTIDSWYGSLNCKPIPYVKANASYSITRDSDPTTPDRAYQTTGAIDARMALSEKVEGRLSYTTNYQGARLRFGHAFSESWNVGGTWLPRSNLNLAATYTYAVYNTAIRNTNSNVNFYVSYSYRKVYSFYVSYGRQQQTQSLTSASPTGSSVLDAKPENWNAQLTLYTGKRSTLTLGYLKSLGTLTGSTSQRRSETYQAVLNFRI